VHAHARDMCVWVDLMRVVCDVCVCYCVYMRVYSYVYMCVCVYVCMYV